MNFKKIFSLTILLFNCVLSFAQNEGKLEYVINVDGATPDLKKTAQMLQDSRMNVYFRPNQTRVDFKLGELMTQTMITDKVSNGALSFSTGMMGNVAIVASIDELSNTKIVDTAATVRFIDETKSILGFNCHKAIVTTGAKEEITYWYTNDIDLNAEGQQFAHPLVPGIPLEFSVFANGLMMHYKLSNYSEKIDNPNSIFSLVPPADFQVMTYSDYQRMVYEQMQKQK